MYPDGNNLNTRKLYNSIKTGAIVHSFDAANASTYDQVGNTVTVVCPAGHLMTAAINNGASIYLAAATGSFVAEWCTNLIYVNPTTFTCTSSVSQTVSGTLATNVSGVTYYTPYQYTLPANILRVGSSLLHTIMYEHNNSAASKGMRAYIDSTAIGGLSVTTSVSARYSGILVNYAENKQKFNGPNSSPAGTLANTGTAVAYSTLDTAVSHTMRPGVVINTAGNWAMITNFDIYLEM